MAPVCSSHFASPAATVAPEASVRDEFGGDRVDLGHGHGAVDHLPLGRFGAVDHAAEEDHLAGALLTDPAGQQPGGAAVGGEAAVDERRPEARVGRRRR